MRTSLPGLMAIISHEGAVTSRYKDSVGVWTIGVGHTAAAGSPDPKTFKETLTLEQILNLFKEDITQYENAVNKAVKVPLEQYEFDALVSFHYNTGRISTATLTKTLNSGNKKKAGQEFMNWVKPPEIKKRREAERDLFLTGRYPAPFATLYTADANGKVNWGKGKKIDISVLLKDVPVVIVNPVEAPPVVVIPTKPEGPVVVVNPPVETPVGFWASIGKLISSIFKKST